MNKIFMLLAVFAIVITVSGSMSQFRFSNGANFLQAHDHGDGGDHDGGDPGPCCDAPPPPCCDAPPPSDEPHDLDGGTKDGATFDGASPLDGAPTLGDVPHDLDGGLKDGLNPTPNDMFYEIDTGSFKPEPVHFFDGGDFSQDVEDFFKEGPGGEFHFEFEPGAAPPEGGLDPGSFSQEFFSKTFDPTEFKGDFGSFFKSDAFGKGELDSLEDFRGLGTQQLVDLTSTTGSDGIVGLDGGQRFSMIESIKADAFD